MKPSRRGFLEISVVGAVGATVLGTTACAPTITTDASPPDPHASGRTTTRRFGLTPNAPVRVRKSVWDLTDAEVRTLCQAVGYARNQFPIADPRKWENYALIHAKHCTDWQHYGPQVHWSWHFLPWHRGYVFFLERILAQALKEQGLDDTTFAYPFWDWTVHQEVPNTKDRLARNLASPLWGYDLTQENMVSADTLGFDNLALFNGNRGPSLAKSQMTPDNEVAASSKAHVVEASRYMSAEYINLALTLPWEEFGGKVDIDRTSQGIIEANPHNDGHDWCGTRFGSNRDMGTLKYAALDPIFFMHHGNIDRIFSLYRGEMPDLDGPWGQQVYTYTDADGSDVTVSVKDIMTTLTNVVQYAVPSDNALVVPTKTLSETATRSHTVGMGGTTTAATPLTLTLNTADLLERDAVYVLEVETGPLVRRGRARINIMSASTNIPLGRIKLLEGDGHGFPETTSHVFRVMLTTLPLTSAPFTIRFEPVNFDAPVEIRRVTLKRLN